MLKIFLILSFLTIIVQSKDANVLMTEVFAVALDPPMFNWTYENFKDQFVYEASLLNAPDLPSWINYVYSETHRSGFLYGVPPNGIDNVPLEVVALNKRTFETRVEPLNIVISEKLNTARYEVHLKIDNLNVENMFDVERMEALKNVFQKKLWPDSTSDLYVTLLSSAIELGARKPLNPNEGEGVVIRLGSESEFSTELIELQEEVKPLWKVPSCPRDFKRTSVERYFRDAGFALDWCSFRLVDNSAMYHTNGNLVMEEQKNEADNDNIWHSISKLDVPQRSYVHETLVSLLVPLIILVVLGMVLSFLLCFEQDEMDDFDENYFNNLFHICTDCYYDHYIYQRASRIEDYLPEQINHAETCPAILETVRSFNNKDATLSPDLCNHSSPNSTMNRGIHCPPSPPPYVRPKFKSDL